MKGIFPIDKFRTLQTPFYYYDTKVLRDTLSAINHEVAKYPNYSVHYAVKANANPKVLTIIRESGMGADCVSGGEIRAAIRAGFPANKVVFHLLRHIYHLVHILHADTEFIFCQTGSDICVSMCAYIRIDTKSNISHLILSSGQFIDSGYGRFCSSL